MTITICFFSATMEIEIDNRKEVYPLTKSKWKLLEWLCENNWHAEVLPATVKLYLN